MAFCFASSTSLALSIHRMDRRAVEVARGGAVIPQGHFGTRIHTYGTRKKLRPLRQEAGASIGVAQRGLQKIDGCKESEERQQERVGKIAWQERPVVGKILFPEIETNDG